MRTRLAVVALLLSVGCATHRSTMPALSVAGTYALSGQNARGLGYAGRVDVLERDGTIYIRWLIDSGEEAYGVGELKGDTLAVRFIADGAVGLASYHRRGPDWVGEWSMLGQPGTFTETWTRDGGAVTKPHPHTTPGVERV